MARAFAQQPRSATGAAGGDRFRSDQGPRGAGASDGHAVYVGGPRLLEMLSLHLPDALAGFARAARRKGQSVVYLVADGQIAAAFALADVIRPESRAGRPAAARDGYRSGDADRR